MVESETEEDILLPLFYALSQADSANFNDEGHGSLAGRDLLTNHY